MNNTGIDQTQPTSEKMEEAPFSLDVAEGPPNGRAYWVVADDGVRLRVALWETDSAPIGTILLFSGRSEYIENYGRTAIDLGKFGFATFAIDWRGHGLSDRLIDDQLKGHVARFTDYQKDVAAMVKAAQELDLPKPWYLVGHSMGACIGLRSVMEGLPVQACAFTSPMWQIKMSKLELLAAWPLSWAAQAIGKGQIYVPGVKQQTYVLSTGFEGNKMTHDPEMFGYWVNQAKTLTDLPTAGPTMGWLYEALKECRSLSKRPSPDIPCAVFCADKDEDIDIHAIQHRMEHWSSGSCELFENSKHELFLETPDIRSSVIAKICDLFAQSG